MVTSGFLILMVVLKTNPLPENPEFKEQMFGCDGIEYVAQYDKYKYIGISYRGKDYLTNETNSDILQNKIDECKKYDN